MNKPTTPLAVTVSILDKEYKVACPSGEKRALLESAEYLDEKMREIKDSGKIIGAERIAVIAALNITHELLNGSIIEGEIKEELSPRLRSLSSKISAALEGSRQLEI